MGIPQFSIAPQRSALFNYLYQNKAGDLIAETFLEQVLHRNRRHIGFYIDETVRGTMMNIAKDCNGNSITSDHPLYDLSRVISLFMEGERTTGEKLRENHNITDDVMRQRSIDDYFVSKGSHFCAGYLSRFGRVVRITGLQNLLPLENKIKWTLRKFNEREYYNAAAKVWEDYSKK